MRCVTFSMRSPNSTTTLILLLPTLYRSLNSLTPKKTLKLLDFSLPSLLGAIERASLRVRPTSCISWDINPDYILNSTASDWEDIDHFVHRTFNIIDLRYYLQALQHLYKHHGGLHGALRPKTTEAFMDNAIGRFRSLF